MADWDYEHAVFVNCPFDAAYEPLFRAIVFTLHDCGFIAHSSLEVTDTSQVRIEKIGAIIAACKYGLHDISRTEIEPETGLPRFNMPLELGLFLGAKRFGTGKQKTKNCLVLDVDRYRYQKFISDIAGQDIAPHGGKAVQVIKVIRDWLRAATPKSIAIPGSSEIIERHFVFRLDLPSTCVRLGHDVNALTFTDYILLVEEWLKSNERPSV